MIIVMHAKHFDAFVGGSSIQRLFADAAIQKDTPVVFSDEIPEEDADGKPILAFKVEAGATHYWRGEPIKLPEGVKL